MKIKLKKEGGFMGMSSNADIELEKLSADEQSMLSDLITNPPQAPKNAGDDIQERGMPMRDSFSYELKVKKGAKYVTLKFNDKSIPEKLYSIFQKYISDTPPI